MSVLWQPNQHRIDAAQITAFARLAKERWPDLDLNNYDAIYQWSIDNPEAFWQAVWDFSEVNASVVGERVLVDGYKMPGARWFPDARLNFAENLLCKRDDSIALVSLLENGVRETTTFEQLYQQVAQLAAYLRELNVQPGDRVAGFMPNVAETVVAMLATSSLGAVWTSCSPDFGFQGVMDRFGQAAPKVLFAADGYYYNGKSHNSLEKLRDISQKIDSVSTVIVVSLLNDSLAISDIANAILYTDVLAKHQHVHDIEFAQLPFDHPLYVMYSSGTTGVPKCIVHGAGGTLLQHLKEHRLLCDVGEDDVFFYFTTCGWMMWNWLVSGLASGATLVLYDGSPFAQQGKLLLDAIDKEGITVFGTSAKFIAALEKEELKPRESHSLASLKTILSTGSPLSHESFEYVYRDFKSDVCLSSIAGGTDIVSCFVGGCPTLPVYTGEIQCRGLGMAVEFWNDDGKALASGKGELVCVKPFPCMPIGFWNDEDGSKYHAAYFDQYENVWCHGDYGEITENGGVIIHGRSDAVLNPGGVRIGTAEIYRQVEKLEQIVESIVIGQDWADDVRVVLFVVLRDGVLLDEQLEDTIRKTIRKHTTPRHVPAKIIAVSDIPRTLSGKIVELAVRNVVHNRPVKNTDALANPDALDLYRDLSDLAS
ncbi:MAG: acetoacetate--CoA ligase [Pseudomonadota bacterium]